MRAVAPRRAALVGVLYATAFSMVFLGVTATRAQQTEPCGDVTQDGSVTAADALATLRAATGLSRCARCRCDVDGSGSIVSSDALQILGFAVGQAVTLMCPACLPTTTSTTTTTTTTTTMTSTTTTTTLPPAKVECGDPRAPAPACDGYCSVNGQMCAEAFPGSGVCECIFGPGCGGAAGPPQCNGGCSALWVCKDIGGTCRCVF